jgi:hypothetical protein
MLAIAGSGALRTLLDIIEDGTITLVLVHNSLDTIQTHLERLELWTVGEADEVVARTVEKISSLAGVQVEEDTWDNNHTLLKTGLEEVETVADGLWETFQVEPEVECRIWNALDLKAHLAEPVDDVVSLLLLCVRWQNL